MTNVVLPFLMSMLLGRTIDLTSYSISGANVYDDANYEEVKVNTLNTTYVVVQNNALPYSSFGIPIDIVLRIKSGMLSSSSGAMGLDGALKDTSWKYNSAVVAVTAVRRTVDRKLKKDAPQLEDWSKKVPFTQTHYADSLIYGGWAVIFFRFQCDIPSDVEKVKKVLTEHLGVVGAVNESTLDSWNKAIDAIKADKGIRGTVDLNTHVYSTVPLSEIDSPESLTQAIKKLQESVGSLGQPLYMNLKPLHDLNDRYQDVQEKVEMLKELKQLDEMFDDVKVTIVSMRRWMQETLTDFDDDAEHKISTLLETLNGCLKAFSALAGEVSLFKDMNRDVLEKAYQKYLEGLKRGIANYNLAFRRIKEEVDADCKDTFLHKIRGLLRVYDDEVQKKGKVDGGFEECQKLCIAEERCRAIGYAEHLSELDLATSLYLKKEKQCWVYLRSTSTATVHTPNGLSGDMGVYDRHCY